MIVMEHIAVILVIEKRFYYGVITNHGNNCKWSDLNVLTTDYPLDYTCWNRRDGRKTFVMAIYPDSTIVRVMIGNQPTPLMYKPSLIDGSRAIELDLPLNPAYTDKSDETLITKSKDGTILYKISVNVSRNASRNSTVMYTSCEACDKDKIDFINVDSNNMPRKVDNIVKYQSVGKCCIYLTSDKILHFPRNTEISNVSNFHLFDSCLYTIEGDELYVRSSDPQDPKLVHLAENGSIKLPLTSRHDVQLPVSMSMKSARK